MSIVATQPERDGSLEDWLVVATSSVCLTVSAIHLGTLGVFLLPIQHELGWSRAEITAGLTVVSVLSVICAPIVGAIIDRVGSRRVALPGIIVYCASVAALGTTTGSIVLWWALWLAVAAGSILIKPTVWMTAVAKRFNHSRGLAFAITLLGTALGATMLPSVAAALINAVGWRHAYMLLGAVGLVIALPPLVVFFHDVQPVDEKATRLALPGLGVREGFLSGAFLRLAIVSFAATAAILSVTVHFVPIMVSYHLSVASAAGIAGAIGIFSAIGQLLIGVLLDRFNGRLVASIGLGLPLGACLLLLNFSGGTFSATIIAAIIGLSLGAEINLITFFAVQYFGLRNYGTLFGTLGGMISFGAGVGPLVSSWFFDRFGSYEPVLWVLMPVFVLCAALMGTLGQPPVFAPAQGEAERQS